MEQGPQIGLEVADRVSEEMGRRHRPREHVGDGLIDGALDLAAVGHDDGVRSIEAGTAAYCVLTTWRRLPDALPGARGGPDVARPEIGDQGVGRGRVTEPLSSLRRIGPVGGAV